MPHLRDGYEPVLNGIQVHVQNNLSSQHTSCLAIDTYPNATVDSVISSVCADRGVQHTPDLVLYASNEEPFNNYMTLQDLKITDGSLLILGSLKSTEKSPPQWGFLGTISLVIGCSGLLAVVLIYTLTGNKIPFDYSIVIDAGSTHSQMLLYSWSGDKDMGTADVSQEDTCSVQGGIHSMRNPADILPCVKKLAELIPSDKHSHSFLYLGATAGMRLLNMTSSRVAELLLSTLHCTLSTAGVTLKRVGIISGVEEGVSSWITTNFLLKTLHPKENGSEPWKSTVGTLDMGGASTQYAFAFNPQHETNTSSLTKVRLYGHNYSIAAQSFLCYGFSEARRRHQALLVSDLDTFLPIYDPCMPQGKQSPVSALQLFNQPCTRNAKFNLWLAENPQHKEKVFEFEGGSDYGNCSSRVQQLLNSSFCTEMGFEECAIAPNMFITEEKYAAVSSFYYITSFLNSTKASLYEFLRNTETWCNMTCADMTDLPLPSKNREMILTYCFGGIYMTQWLTQMYGFDNSTWKNLMFRDTVGKSDLGWALGFMINESNAISEEAPTPASISSTTLAIVIVCCILIIFASFLFFRNYFTERQYRSDPGRTRLMEA